ncbi:hypothetical protein [Anaerosphaera multitolerans]|uniref:N-acetyltransferase domain-containing protein n=1 Tax=Anaerosphaera multitolerans TaxID=2487351 RepID=A0A437S556_9FIRM|nr:hypothetical protein [Anaerosphaera multitolerans]RVU54056.1 hypothetical protein EF514_09310 [Anaerosphaera multitolerans]
MKKLPMGDGLYYRFLDGNDLEELLVLIDHVYDGMEDKTAYIMDTEEEVLEQLTSENDKVVGIFNEEGKLIAFRHMELGIERKQLPKYVDIVEIPVEGTLYHGGAMVHEDYRGRGLQNRTRKIMEETLENENFHRATSTVSPYNYFSMKNVFKSGFALVGYVEEYPAGEDMFEERFIFFKDSKNPFEFSGNNLKVNLFDGKAILKALSEGYVGIDVDYDTLTMAQLSEYGEVAAESDLLYEI